MNLRKKSGDARRRSLSASTVPFLLTVGLLVCLPSTAWGQDDLPDLMPSDSIEEGNFPSFGNQDGAGLSQGGGPFGGMIRDTGRLNPQQLLSRVQFITMLLALFKGSNTQSSAALAIQNLDRANSASRSGDAGLGRLPSVALPIVGIGIAGGQANVRAPADDRLGSWGAGSIVRGQPSGVVDDLPEVGPPGMRGGDTAATNPEPSAPSQPPTDPNPVGSFFPKGFVNETHPIF